MPCGQKKAVLCFQSVQTVDVCKGLTQISGATSESKSTQAPQLGSTAPSQAEGGALVTG